MLKRNLKIITVVIFIIVLYSTLSYADETDYQYVVNEDGNIEITAYSGKEKNVVIPTEIDGAKVVAIGKAAFENNSKIKTVIIPESVTKLGQNAFYDCVNLEQVAVLGDIATLGSGVFSSCRDLYRVDFYGDLCGISVGMFFECINLENIFIPKSVTYIGSGAFMYCSALLSIDIPEGVETINDRTFSSCGKLKNVTLPSTLKYIEEYAFSKCDSINEICIPKNIEFVNNDVFIDCDNIEKIFVHENISTYNKDHLLGTYSTLPMDPSIIHYYNDDNCGGLVFADVGLLNAELENHLSKLGYSKEKYTIVEYKEEVNGIWVEVKFAGEEEYLIRIKQTLEGEPYLLYSNAIENTDNKTDDVVISNGDVNSDGFVDATDALLILKHSARLEIMDIEKEDISDLNDDGIIDANDALIILQIATNLI